MKLHNTATCPEKSINEEESRNKTADNVKDIGDRQSMLFAESKKSLLVIFQGMDTSGKDGAIKKVFADVNPNGCHVISFGRPTEREYSQDFLWRIHHHTPPFGMIHIFNRSHYEDILVPSVEGYIDQSIIKERYQQINDFEKMLEANGTTIVKFFLHISKEEQEERLKERMTNPKKFWKHKDSDWTAREKWDQYLEAYDTIIEKCNIVPWHIIPADKNWYKELLVSGQVEMALKKIGSKFPPLITNLT